MYPDFQPTTEFLIFLDRYHYYDINYFMYYYYL